MINNVLLISSLLPKKLYEILINSEDGISSLASQKFYKLFRSAFEENGSEVTVFSTYVSPLFKNEDKNFNEENIFLACYFNDSVETGELKQSKTLSKKIVEWCNAHKDGVVIFDGINRKATFACLKAKRKVKNKFVCVVTDVPTIRVYKSKNIIKKLFMSYHQHLLKKFKLFIVLTDYMAKLYESKNRRVLRVEGFAKDNLPKPSYPRKKEFINVVYTGIINDDFGINELIDAFDLLPENYRLELYGKWQMSKSVEDSLKNHSQVSYFGEISNDKIIAIQEKSSCLINPRRTNGTYIKYSFPSKFIEYLSSGTLTLTTKLDGIPDEYFDYCFVINEVCATEIAKTILNVNSLSDEDKNAFVQKTLSFLSNNKTCSVQGNKMIKFLEEL